MKISRNYYEFDKFDYYLLLIQWNLKFYSNYAIYLSLKRSILLESLDFYL